MNLNAESVNDEDDTQVDTAVKTTPEGGEEEEEINELPLSELENNLVDMVMFFNNSVVEASER